MRLVRLLLASAAVVAAGIAWFEITMDPTASERTQLFLMFAATAGAAGLAALAFPWWAERSRSLGRTAVALALTGTVVVAAGVALVATQMFLSSHDLQLLGVALVVAVLAGLVFAFGVARPWMRDLERTASAAAQIGAGALTARTDVRRPDEIGRVAAAVDAMAVQLEAADRLRRENEASRRHFLAAIGHDLRTPLAALRAAVEALRDGIAPDPDRYLQSMERDIEALSRLVDDLFLLARIEAGALEIEATVVDLTEIADEAIEVLRPVAAQRDVRLALVADRRVLVTGGSEALSRVIRNLVDNAIRHAPPGGAVTVAIEDEEGAAVTVTDSGPGFEPEFVDQAFRSFSRSDPARERTTGGAGLGLAIAHGFVTAMGGDIWAAPGPGGRVGFTMPAGAATT